MPKDSSKPPSSQEEGESKPKKHYASPHLKGSIKRNSSDSYVWFSNNMGSICSILLAFLLIGVLFRVLTNQEYLSIVYWLEVIETTPQISLETLFSAIPKVNLPNWLFFIEATLNLFIEPLNMILGLSGALVNVFTVLMHFALALLGLLVV